MSDIETEVLYTWIHICLCFNVSFEVKNIKGSQKTNYHISTMPISPHLKGIRTFHAELEPFMLSSIIRRLFHHNQQIILLISP